MIAPHSVRVLAALLALCLAAPAGAVTFHPAQGLGFDPDRHNGKVVWRKMPPDRVTQRAAQDSSTGFLQLFSEDPWSRGRPPIPSIITGPWRIPPVAEGPPALSVIPLPAAVWLLGGSVLALALIGRQSASATPSARRRARRAR